MKTSIWNFCSKVNIDEKRRFSRSLYTLKTLVFAALDNFNRGDLLILRVWRETAYPTHLHLFNGSIKQSLLPIQAEELGEVLCLKNHTQPLSIGVTQYAQVVLNIVVSAIGKSRSGCSRQQHLLAFLDLIFMLLVSDR